LRAVPWLRFCFKLFLLQVTILPIDYSIAGSRVDELRLAEQTCAGIPLGGFVERSELSVGGSVDVNGFTFKFRKERARTLQQPLENYRADIELVNRLYFPSCITWTQCRAKKRGKLGLSKRERRLFFSVERSEPRTYVDAVVVVDTPAQKTRANEETVQDQRALPWTSPPLSHSL